MAKVVNFHSDKDLNNEDFYSQLENDFQFQNRTWYELLNEFNEILIILSLDQKLDLSFKAKWIEKISEYFLLNFSTEIEFDSKNNFSISNVFLCSLIEKSMNSGNLELSKKLSTKLKASKLTGSENILIKILHFLGVEELYALLKSQIKRNNIFLIGKIYQEFYSQCISLKMWNEKFRFFLEELRSLSKIYLQESNYKQAFQIDLLLLIDLCVSQYTKLQVPMFRRKKEFLFLFYCRNSYEFGLFTLLLYSKIAGNREIYDSILNLIKEQKNKNLNLLNKDVFSSLLVVDFKRNESFYEDHDPTKIILPKVDTGLLQEDYQADSIDKMLQSENTGNENSRVPLTINFRPSNEEENKIYIETLKQFGKFKEAVKYIRNNQLNKDLYWILEEAELLFKLNEWEESLQVLEGVNLELQKIEFQNAGNYLLGEIYQKQGQLALARGYYKKVFSNNPNYLLVKNKLNETK